MLNPYLNFDGETEEAFNFYKSVFGGEFAVFQRFKDMPDSDKMPADQQEKVMHVSLPVGASMLMGSDTMEGMGPPLSVGNNVHISVSPESKEETKRIFDGLSKGGNIDMPLDDMFWGSYFGACTDKFGVRWMVNFDYNQQK